MKLNKNFRFFKEPYTKEERYWVVDIEEGDIYKIDKNVFDCLNKINNGETSDIDSNIVSELKEINVIEDDK